jgi:F0F1-type ATP synthase membrane subunit b/b'
MFFFAAEVEDPNIMSLLFDPKSNFINWLILVVLVVWACAKYLPPVFAARKQSIDDQITSAREAKESAAKVLAEHKIKIAEADKEIENIVLEAKQAAAQMQRQIEEQTKKDIEDLRHKFEVSAATEKQVAISEMRAIAIKAAVRVAEESLSGSLSEADKAKLLNQFVEQIDQITANEEYAPLSEAQSIH